MTYLQISLFSISFFSLTQVIAYEISPEFYRCEAEMIAECTAKGIPAKIIPGYGANGDVSSYYPAPPPGVKDSNFSFVYNCLYTNPLFPGTLNYYSGYLSKTCGYIVTDPLKVKIDSFRIGQRVFEPSISGPGSIDLVANQSIAVEITVSGEVPLWYQTRGYVPELWIDGVKAYSYYGNDGRFAGKDILNPNAKAFVFSFYGVTAGPHDFSVRLVPYDPFPFYFDMDDQIISDSRNVTAHNVTMNVSYNGILCSGSVDCFQPPLDTDFSKFSNESYNFVREHLPISQLNINRVPNITQTPSDFGQGFRGIWGDLLKSWIQKKLGLHDVAVSLVGQDYFIKQLPSLAVAPKVIGLTDGVKRGTVLLQPKFAPNLAHELVHVGGGSNTHNVPAKVNGIGWNANQISTDGFKLQLYFPPFSENKAWNFYSEIFPANESFYNLDYETYVTVFKNFKNKAFDPQVILVTGLIQNDKIIELSMTSGMAELDLPAEGANLTVEGKTSSGETVSSVSVQGSSKLILEFEGLPGQEYETAIQAFTATLPDDGNRIQSIRVLSANGLEIPVVGSEPVTTTTLPPVTTTTVPPTTTSTTTTLPPPSNVSFDYAMKHLSKDSFKGGRQVAQLAFNVSRVAYEGFLKLQAKGKYKEARAALAVLSVDLGLVLKDSFIMTDGKPLTKVVLIGLLKTELAKIPK